jgi:hypothetical protein
MTQIRFEEYFSAAGGGTSSRRDYRRKPGSAGRKAGRRACAIAIARAAQAKSGFFEIFLK